MVDNSTANVNTVKSGTGWTVDVTPCNLLQDTSIKDFRVLFDGNLQGLADFEKIDPSTIKYNGSSISSTNVEVRRVTPPDRVQEVNFGQKFSSALWEAELNRQSRIAHELELNGALGGNTFTAPSIKDDPFGSSWNNDGSNGASRNALYDEIITRVADTSGSADGLQLTNVSRENTAPTVALGNSNNIIATTSFVHGRIDSDLSNDPTLGDGSSLQSNPGVGSTGTQIATTQFVNDYIESSNFGTINGSVTIDGGLTVQSGTIYAPDGTIRGGQGMLVENQLLDVNAGADIDSGATVSGELTLDTDRINQTDSGAPVNHFASGINVDNGVTVDGGIDMNSGGIVIDNGDVDINSGRIIQNGTFSSVFNSGLFVDQSLDVDGGCTISGGLDVDSGGGNITGSISMDTITGGVELQDSPVVDFDPPISSDDQELATTAWTKDIFNNSYFLVTLSSNQLQTVPPNVDTITVNLDSEEFDEGFDFSTVNHEWTAPYQGFYYLEFITSAVDQDGTLLEKANPVLDVSSTRMTSGEYQGWEYLAGQEANTLRGSVSLVAKLDAGDTVTPKLDYSAGTNFDIISGVTNTRFMGYLLKRES